jgi:hypothetical protein
MGACKKLQSALEINLLEVGTIPPVPLGTFPDVPLPLAFLGAARLLPISKTRMRGFPLAADPARSLFVLTLFFHRFLRRVTLRKQWRISLCLNIKVGGSLMTVG